MWERTQPIDFKIRPPRNHLPDTLRQGYLCASEDCRSSTKFIDAALHQRWTHTCLGTLGDVSLCLWMVPFVLLLAEATPLFQRPLSAPSSALCRLGLFSFLTLALSFLSFPFVFFPVGGQALTAHFEKATVSAGCTILAGCLAGCGGGILADLLRFVFVRSSSVNVSLRVVGRGTRHSE